MQTGFHSQMAEAVAQFRAAHQLLDDEPRILVDPLALTLLGPDAAADIEAKRELHQRWFMKRARAIAVVRSRYTEDQLAEAIAQGVRQYVILGAGLDTSPYRPGHPSESAETWEIDHPDTQAWKLERLRSAGIEWRDNLCHLSVDFERERPLTRLIEHGFDPNGPAVFSWLGVNYYLQPAAVEDMFREVASCASGTRIVMDFAVSDAQLTTDERETVAKVMAAAEDRGEPWLARYAPEDLQALLRECGFGHSEYLSCAAATGRYLSGRTDGLELDRSIQLMTGIV